MEIEIPPETLAEVADIELMEPEDYPRQPANSGQIATAAQILSNAAKPLIWVGGGAVSSGASGALLQVAEYLQAPVVSTPEGKGAISDHHYLSLGALRLRGDPIAQASAGHDVVLAVGTRLANPNLLDGQQVIQIDIDGDELGRNYANTFGIQGNARRTLEDLYSVLSANGPSTTQPAE